MYKLKPEKQEHMFNFKPSMNSLPHPLFGEGSVAIPHFLVRLMVAGSWGSWSTDIIQDVTRWLLNHSSDDTKGYKSGARCEQCIEQDVEKGTELPGPL